jgi:hypothetical protein
MKPYLAKILEHNGKRHTLPLPSKYRELLDCVKALDIKDSADEDDMKVVGYKAMLIPVPDADAPDYEVDWVANKLSTLTGEQVKAVGDLCRAFGMGFENVYDILTRIAECKGMKEWLRNEN